MQLCCGVSGVVCCGCVPVFRVLYLFCSVVVFRVLYAGVALLFSDVVCWGCVALFQMFFFLLHLCSCVPGIAWRTCVALYLVLHNALVLSCRCCVAEVRVMHGGRPGPPRPRGSRPTCTAAGPLWQHFCASLKEKKNAVCCLWLSGTCVSRVLAVVCR